VSDARRAAESPAVHSLNCFSFTVPDLEEARRFFCAFGLEVRQEGGRLGLFTRERRLPWAIVSEHAGHPKQLKFVSFGCYECDFDTLAARLRALGIEHRAPHPLGPEGGLWMAHPDGFAVQVIAAEKSSPDFDATPSVAEPAGLRRAVAPNRSRLEPVSPRRLSHVLLFTPDVARSIAFYEAALGLRVSDRSADHIAFMHAVHGSDHHLLAIARSEGPGLHHSCWDVRSIDEVGAGMQQMTLAGYTSGWGVGRHVLGSNYFYYARDPWGSYCEYSFDIDYVPKGYRWPAGDHPPEDSFYLWGPTVPKDFVTNFELAAVPCAS
jgi:catechol 2,3-dioxygenase-like lactoylglutathione lyase family enzyme